MKLQILSDMHHEFYYDLDFESISAADFSQADCLILAGDIASCSPLPSVLEQYCLHTKGKCEVLFVPGNHEYYGGGRTKVKKTLRQLERNFSHFHALDNKAFELNGQRFVGSTLWYPSEGDAGISFGSWSDFRCIPGTPEAWIFKRASECRAFLEENLQSGDIAISHMLPSFRSVHRKYANSWTNCFFVHNCEDLILARKPKMWIHGHTHETMDYMIENTHIVANPRGAPEHRWEQPYENALYMPSFIVEI